MNYPFFEIQTPFSTLQLEVSRFIHSTLSKSYSGITTKLLYGVPISQVYNPANTSRLTGRNFGKIAVLVVDMLDYTPLCAVLTESFLESKVTDEVESLLNEAMLPYAKVNSRNLERVLSDLLQRSLISSSSTAAKSPVEKTEWMIARYFRQLIKMLPDDYRVMEQVGMTEIIETLNLDNRNLHKPKNWQNPQNNREFEALSKNDQYFKLNDFAARTSIDILIVNKVVIGKDEEWWPVLAIEIDGGKHQTDEHQKFNDTLKDRICDEALLPLLRIKLYESEHNLYRLTENKINDIPSAKDKSIVIELISFLFFESIRNGHFAAQNERRQERRKYINKARRIKVLLQKGYSIEESLEIFQSENSEELYVDWLNDITNVHVEEQIKKYENKKFESEYRAIYGKKPQINVNVSRDGTLTGNLGTLNLPKVKCISSFLGEENIEKYLLEFGREWLIRNSLYSEKIIW